MMNDSEKKGCMSILKKLDHGDLMSLMDTVTKKQITAGSVQEAMKIIILYSQSSAELLKRVKIRRDVLFQYLANNKIVVPTTSDKHQLIAKCLESWGSDVNQNSSFELDDKVPTKSEPQRFVPQQPPTRQSKSEPQRSVPQQPPTRQSKSEPQLVPSTSGNLVPSLLTQPVPQAISMHFATEVNPNHSGSVSVQAAIQIQPNQETKLEYSLHVDNSQTSSCNSTTNSEQQTLGEMFASWFYKNINSHNPLLGQNPQDFGPKDFWNDVTLQLISYTPQPSLDSYEGSDFVSQRLLALVKEEMLLFNPNISGDGISVKTDPHGLTCVVVCGTLHRQNDCLGVFQQMFGLVRDPRFENNWKIKTTKLKLQSGQILSMPQLQDLPSMEAIMP